MKKILFCSVIICGAFCCSTGFSARIFNDQVCYKINIGGARESTKCAGKSWHDQCSPSNAPTDSGWCIYDTVRGGNELSCAAKKCKDTHLLWTTNTRQEISVKGTSGKVGSQGLCYSKTDLNNRCKNACGKCIHLH